MDRRFSIAASQEPSRSPASDDAKLIPEEELNRMEAVAAALDSAASQEEELVSQTGLSREEIDEVCLLFQKQSSAAGTESLFIESVDVVLRKLGIYVSSRYLWALCWENDSNKNNQVELDEFLVMVGKLRGRIPVSREFHIRALPRALLSRFTKVFVIFDSDSDGLLDEDQFMRSVKELSPHADPESEAFKELWEGHVASKAEGEPITFSVEDFLCLHAQLRKPPLEIEAAILSLTSEETERYSQAFRDWRGSERGGSTSELRSTLSHAGYPVTGDTLKRLLAEVEAESVKTLSLPQFLLMMVKLGAGTSDQLRRIPRPGSTYEEAFSQGFTLEELWELGYDDLAQIRAAGWSAHAVWRAAFAEPYQLRQVGFSARELRKVGCSARQLKLAGFSFEDLRNAGFSCEVLADCHALLTRHSGHREEKGMVLRPISQEGDARGEGRWWATPRVQDTLSRAPGVQRPSAAVSA